MEEASKIAAKWWADKLRQPVQHDNGDGLQSVMLTSMSQHFERPDSETIDRFEKCLFEALLNQDEEIKRYGDYFFGVDYHPSGILAESAELSKCEIDYLLPVKTKMWFGHERIRVAEGYGAKAVQIWPEEAT